MTKQKSDIQTTYASEARKIMRLSLTATLATLEPETHDPAASLIAVATDMRGTPLLLISDLAQHTRNITADSRAAILFDDTARHDSPLEGGRVSLKGRLTTIEDKDRVERFLRRHPDARDYSGFTDFHFYRLEVDHANFVGGFGKIQTIKASDILLENALTKALEAAEAKILNDMNKDHSDLLQLHAAQAGSPVKKGWQMTGMDPEGFDLRHLGTPLRIEFPEPVKTPQQAQSLLLDKVLN